MGVFLYTRRRLDFGGDGEGNLTWIRTRSVNPRELHAGYVGITLPMNHEFWQSNQPGNLWNCKCDWKTTDAPITGAPGKIAPPARGLEGNPFTTGELVTNRHPYYKDAPDWVKRNAMLLLPDELAFIKSDAGDFMEHILIEGADEAAENRLIASLLSQNGYSNVELLPTIHRSEVALRQRYYGKAFNLIEPNKCPDCRVDDKLIEFKKTGGADRSIRARISEAALKSDIIVIKLQNDVTYSKLAKLAYGKKNTYPGKVIIFITNDLQVLTF